MLPPGPIKSCVVRLGANCFQGCTCFSPEAVRLIFVGGDRKVIRMREEDQYGVSLSSHGQPFPSFLLQNVKQKVALHNFTIFASKSRALADDFHVMSHKACLVSRWSCVIISQASSRRPRVKDSSSTSAASSSTQCPERQFSP